METFNRIVGTVFVALVASILFFTVASFIGVRPAEDPSLLAQTCGEQVPGHVQYAGMREASC